MNLLKICQDAGSMPLTVNSSQHQLGMNRAHFTDKGNPALKSQRNLAQAYFQSPRSFHSRWHKPFSDSFLGVSVKYPMFYGHLNKKKVRMSMFYEKKF